MCATCYEQDIMNREADKASDDLVNELRAGVIIAQNGNVTKWRPKTLMQAADEIESLRAQLAAAEADLDDQAKMLDMFSNKSPQQYEKEAAALKAQPESAKKALEAARAETIEECAKVAEAQGKEFLSPNYASNQPFGSLCERFACDEVAKAIRALKNCKNLQREILNRDDLDYFAANMGGTDGN